MAAAKPGLGQIRLHDQRLVIGGKGLVEAPEVGQQMTEPRSGQVRLQGDRLVEGGERFVMPPHRRECIATTEPCLGQIGLERQGLVEQRDRLERPPAIHRIDGILVCLLCRAHRAFANPV
nr:hypothetical protein [Bradyrhizobium sp. UBA2491]